MTILRSEPELLEAEVSYDPGGKRPPAHLHPAQDESFEVLAGAISVRIDGEQRSYSASESFQIPRGTSHQMWNPNDEPARVRWQTRPAGRTRQWWEELDAFQRSGDVGSDGMPGPLAMGVLLRHYRDVFRLAVGPRPLTDAAVALLGAAGRLRGHRPNAHGS